MTVEGYRYFTYFSEDGIYTILICFCRQQSMPPIVHSEQMLLEGAGVGLLTLRKNTNVRSHRQRWMSNETITEEKGVSVPLPEAQRLTERAECRYLFLRPIYRNCRRNIVSAKRGLAVYYTAGCAMYMYVHTPWREGRCVRLLSIAHGISITLAFTALR